MESEEAHGPCHRQGNRTVLHINAWQATPCATVLHINACHCLGLARTVWVGPPIRPFYTFIQGVCWCVQCGPGRFRFNMKTNSVDINMFACLHRQRCRFTLGKTKAARMTAQVNHTHKHPHPLKGKDDSLRVLALTSVPPAECSTNSANLLRTNLLPDARAAISKRSERHLREVCFCRGCKQAKVIW